MKWLITMFAIVLVLVGCGNRKQEQRYASLGHVIADAYRAGKLADVKTLCAEYLASAKDGPEGWNYGNAVHDGNTYLGLVALDEDRRVDAISHLLRAGDTPGSPQLNSFGPNMLLAKALLEKGEKQAVLDYLEEVGSFWEMDYGQLTTWKKDIEAGRTPDFGDNLRH